MKAIVCDAFGLIENLLYDDLPALQAGVNQLSHNVYESQMSHLV